MRHIVSVTILALALAACSKPAAAPEASSSAAPPPQDFTVQALTEADNDIQGCQVMLDQKGVGQVFLEDGVDTGAHGYIRIDGTKYRVDLTSSVQDEKKGGVRVFADAKAGLTVTEKLKVGEAHQESDSVEQSGTITVTFKGITKEIAVDGGTAC